MQSGLVEALGWQVVNANNAAASEMPVARIVSQSAPDGDTLLSGDIAIWQTSS